MKTSKPANAFAIVANVSQDDRIFRFGALVWLASVTGGEGYDRCIWIGKSKGGRIITKWTATKRFARFRPKWIPPYLDQQVIYRGTRDEMAALANILNKEDDHADQQATTKV